MPSNNITLPADRLGDLNEAHGSAFGKLGGAW